MQSKDADNKCKGIEMKKDDNGNVYPSFTPVPLDCKTKLAFAICSIDKPKYDSPQKPFSKFPCIKKLSKGRNKRTSMLERENSENKSENGMIL